MQARAVDELFAEYAAAFGRGERPRAGEYLARAGGERDELAALIDRFLRAAPRPTATVEDSVLLAGWLQHEPPILELRRRQGLKRGEVVERLLGALGLKAASRERLADAYHELETGQLDPAGVDASVWRALAEILRANVRELAGRRPPPLAAEPAFRFGSPEVSVESELVIRQDQSAAGDDVDRLFRSVG